MSDRLQKELDEARQTIERLEVQVSDLEDRCEDYYEELSALEVNIENLRDRGPVVADIMALPSLDRDAFLADLARECALLGVEWPPSCKDATRVIHRDPNGYTYISE